MIPTFAVVPSDGRPVLDECLAAVADQVDAIILIGNNWQRPVGIGGPTTYVTLDCGADRNISRWWNQGLRKAAALARRRGYAQWNVAVLNDDAVIPTSWVEALSAAMRSTTAVLAYPDQCGGQQQILHTKAEPVDLRQRITGYAYMLRGEAGLQLDESMAWWFSDDSLDWESRENGGALLVPGIPVRHLYPNGFTDAHPELQEQAGRDRETFIAKWGRAPH
ncbi:NTP transferase domain-containing protein [Streptomyces sp. NRRL B-24720]|uniref:NTP transferase domain-containing protein n=1 Tax=Streptomyces sp. NRRL B-24720 TaxID=1476876 RepID=UPI0004C918A7|nr:NTP transferase domain-containing protein [Streptomyces sp. NRRL B-24720]